MLIFSNIGNDYGDIEIDGGILVVKDVVVFGIGDVMIVESVMFVLSQGMLDNNVIGEG